MTKGKCPKSERVFFSLIPPRTEYADIHRITPTQNIIVERKRERGRATKPPLRAHRPFACTPQRRRLLYLVARAQYAHSLRSRLESTNESASGYAFTTHNNSHRHTHETRACTENRRAIMAESGVCGKKWKGGWEERFVSD